jgi:hypothetical protein
MKTLLALLLFWGSLVAAQTPFSNVCVVDGSKNAGLAGINSCNSSFSSSSPGLTWISGNTPKAARWTSPPNGTMVIDTRFANSPGFVEGELRNQKPHLALTWHAGETDTYENASAPPYSGPMGVDTSCFADGGGINGDNTRANVLCLGAYADRSISSARPIWATNFAVKYNVTNTSNMATGLEIDVGSQDADDVHQQGGGMRIINGGPHKVGFGFIVNGASHPFVRGGTITNYAEVGLSMQAGQKRTADFYIVPPADDNGPSFILRDAANKETVFAINDSGDLATTGSIRGKNVPIVTSFTTTSAATDAVTVNGMTASGHCSLTPTNAEAARGSASVYVSSKTTNRISVTHAPSPGWMFDVMCTPN